MKQFFPGLIFIAFLLILWGCEKKEANLVYDGSYKEEIKQTRKDFASYLARNHIPGANIAIAKNNELIYSEGIGLASKELKVPMTRENKLRVGDVSQLFTSIVYLKLAEEGVLVPDSSLQYYLKNYPETDLKIRLKHLSYHTSGIRKEEQNEIFLEGRPLSLQKGLEIFMNDELSSPPGWYEETSIFNTNLLGAVMERATGKKFPRLLKEYITDTLNLNNTVIDYPEVTIEGRSEFYDIDMLGRVINAPQHKMGHSVPSIGILSNAEDLVKLGMAILNSDYFGEEFTQKLFEPCNLHGNYKSKMANGWILTLDKEGRDINARSGSVTGGGAALVIYPEEKLVIAYAQNLTPGNESLAVLNIANHYLKDSKPKEK